MEPAGLQSPAPLAWQNCTARASTLACEVVPFAAPHCSVEGETATAANPNSCAPAGRGFIAATASHIPAPTAAPALSAAAIVLHIVASPWEESSGGILAYTFPSIPTARQARSCAGWKKRSPQPSERAGFQEDPIWKRAC
jgi:hypothetical protein